MLERENVYDSIRDLEYDFEMGKIERADYERFHRELRADALAILQRERTAAGAPAAGAPESDAPAGEVRPAACATCGTSLAPGARFCSQCGVAVAGPADSNEAPADSGHAAGPAGREVGRG